MPVKHIPLTALLVVLLGQTEPAMSSTLADPTRPGYLSTHSSQKGFSHNADDWVLKSTLVSPNRRVAVINGKHVSEGESVGSAVVVEIRKLDVDIRISGKRITLPLLPDIVERQP